MWRSKRTIIGNGPGLSGHHLFRLSTANQFTFQKKSTQSVYRGVYRGVYRYNAPHRKVNVDRKYKELDWWRKVGFSSFTLRYLFFLSLDLELVSRENKSI